MISYQHPVISLGRFVQGVGKDIIWYLSVVLNATKYCFSAPSHLLGTNIENLCYKLDAIILLLYEWETNGGLTSYMTITSAH